MDLLDMVPMLRRHINQYTTDSHTDSILAGYIADGIYALNWRWSRDYVITTVTPNTYSVSPDIAARDFRPAILMASLIFKMGNVDLARFSDGDFAYDPQQGRYNPITLDLQELDRLVPQLSKPLVKAVSAPLRGFENGYNPESYNWLRALGALGAISGPPGII